MRKPRLVRDAFVVVCVLLYYRTFPNYCHSCVCIYNGETWNSSVYGGGGGGGGGLIHIQIQLMRVTSIFDTNSNKMILLL